MSSGNRSTTSEQGLADQVAATIAALIKKGENLKNGAAIPGMPNWYLAPSGLAFGDSRTPLTIARAMKVSDPGWFTREMIKALSRMA